MNWQKNISDVELSVIVPFWNVENYFDSCLRSLQNQQGLNFEFILIDDCSEDSSIKIAENYIALDSRFKLIRNKKNLGVGGSRNAGIAQSRARYIWFVDSDDIIPPNVCADLISEAKAQESDVLYFNYEKDFSEGLRADEQKYVRGVLPDHEEVKDTALAVSSFVYQHLFHSYTSSNKIWSREFLINNSCFFEECIHFEDNIHTFWLLKAQRIGFYDRYCYIHRIRSESITTKKRKPEDYIHHIKMVQSFNRYSHQIDLNILSHSSVYVVKYLQMVVFNNWLIKCYAAADLKYRERIIKECSEALLGMPVIDNQKSMVDALYFYKYKFGYSELRAALLAKSLEKTQQALKIIFDASIGISLKKVFRYLKPYGLMEG